MAIYPKNFTNQDVLSPGARGETLQASLPGYRDGADRINRTNSNLNTNAHDVPNIKYELDRRLPPLFKYGFAYGFNQIVIPKGRIVAVDPYMNTLNSDMLPGVGVDAEGNAFKTPKSYNTLTIANGGVPVKLREESDVYPADAKYVAPDARGQKVNGIGKEWIPLVGFETAYDAKTSAFRPFSQVYPKQQLKDAGYEVSNTTGKVEVDGVSVNTVRPANTPVGIMQRNEYTRNDDAFNGIMPGAVLTDAMVELPWFGFKDRAEQNPWGSAYGDLFPGALVKSDENGRFVISPLSYIEENEETGMIIGEYELERQQVVGQVYSVNRDLLPDGAARWATWALEDRRNFREFNPDVYRKTNRDGEDNTINSAYHTTGEYPGYPYDNTILEHDLHMLESNRPFSNRMNDQYQFDNLGIPGLTDGKNAVKRTYAWQTGAVVSEDKNATEYVDVYMRTSEVDVNNLMIKIDDGDAVACVKDAVITAKAADGTTSTFAVVKYADELQGIVVLSIRDAEAANAYMEAKNANGGAAELTVKLKFDKRGVSGVPTFMDWDGCMGSVKILLTK